MWPTCSAMARFEARRVERLASSGTSTIHDAADARGLAQHGGRVGHVLEHVRQDADVERSVFERQRRPVVALDVGAGEAAGGDVDGPLGDLDAGE